VSGAVEVAALPFALTWEVEPVEFRTGPDSVRAEAGPETDLFVDPGTGRAQTTTPRLVGNVVGDYMLSARVRADLRATFDAGALLLWSDERSWAKLCLELSPERDPMIVSVVTRGVSDDCNAFVVEGDVWLRLARIGGAYAFHASRDGRRWQLVRHFALETQGEPRPGFLVQSPRGAGCVATFDEISFVPGRLADIRSGD
jgi:regulation of enolase protein 1 (concanavalin A-like superfamily)